jgi:hypothetical protein
MTTDNATPKTITQIRTLATGDLVASVDSDRFTTGDDLAAHLADVVQLCKTLGYEVYTSTRPA